MRFLRVAGVVAMGVMAIGLPGCTEGKHPFRMVQFCLKGANEIPSFISFMRTLAEKHGMQFYDRSSDTHAELQSLNRNNKNVPVNEHAVDIGAQRGSQFSFGAGNLGMPTDQIVIGFNGADLEAANLSPTALYRASRIDGVFARLPPVRARSPCLNAASSVVSF